VFAKRALLMPHIISSAAGLVPANGRRQAESEPKTLGQKRVLKRFSLSDRQKMREKSKQKNETNTITRILSSMEPRQKRA
jgi:hypothetical protein